MLLDIQFLLQNKFVLSWLRHLTPSSLMLYKRRIFCCTTVMSYIFYNLSNSRLQLLSYRKIPINVKSNYRITLFLLVGALHFKTSYNKVTSKLLSCWQIHFSFFITQINVFHHSSFKFSSLFYFTNIQFIMTSC